MAGGGQVKEVLICLASAAAFGALHAVRGAGHQWLRWLMAGGAGGLTWALAPADLIGAVMTGAGLFGFLVQPWGRWYTLGAGERIWAGPPSSYEAVLERFADRIFPPRREGVGSARADALAWAISASLFVLPLAVLASPWWAMLPVLMIATYALALMYVGCGPHVRVGEAATGAVIGAMIVLLAGCAPQPSSGDLWREVPPVLY
jgi:hypothetical protein